MQQAQQVLNLLRGGKAHSLCSCRAMKGVTDQNGATASTLFLLQDDDDNNSSTSLYTDGTILQHSSPNRVLHVLVV